jgi:hypothetical protein
MTECRLLAVSDARSKTMPVFYRNDTSERFALGGASLYFSISFSDLMGVRSALFLDVRDRCNVQQLFDIDYRKLVFSMGRRVNFKIAIFI